MDYDGQIGGAIVVTRVVEAWRDKAHYISASVLFVTLALMSLFLFVKTDKSKRPTKKKIQRNLIYRVCGVVMLACCVLTLLTSKGIIPNFPRSIFIFETIMLWAFGFSWLVKGETILKDK